LPDLRDPRFQLERETLKLVVQHPGVMSGVVGDLGDNDFSHPVYRAVWDAVTALGGPGNVAGEVWVGKLRDLVGAEDGSGQSDEVGGAVVQAVNALAVEPLLREPDPAYALQHVLRLQELTALRRIAQLKSKLQRTNPVEEAVAYNRMFGELVAVESHRRTLRERAIGVTS
jgi:DNA primase